MTVTYFPCQVTLARECVLTGFSIYPSQEMFEKIVEMAIHSGLDKIGADEDEGVKDDPEKEEDDEKRSRHCRVTDFKKPTYSSRLFIFMFSLTPSHQYGNNLNHNLCITIQDC